MTKRLVETEPLLDIAVAGGGPAGLTAALLLARQGVAVTLIAPVGPEDPRTTALMQGSLRILEQIGLWPDLKGRSGPLRRLRMIDATQRLFRAPELTFKAEELKLDAFGWNIPNAVLVAAMRDEIARSDKVRLIQASVTGLRADANEDVVALQLDDASEVRCRLLIAADGRDSICRESAGISKRSWSYDQVALAMNLRHEKPHGDTSTEFHTDSGPFTLVPLPGARSSLVAVLRPDEAQRLKDMDDAALGAELTRRSHGLLGRIEPDGRRGVFPITATVARSFAMHRVALVGEAGHVLPPIGAQGLNLGMRDAAAIAAAAVSAVRIGNDPGSASVLRTYHRARSLDVWPRTFAVDALNRSLLAGLLPVDAARSFALAAIGRIPLIRRTAMRAGIGV